MYNKLKELTIVIPTYYRQIYALRVMRYWSGRGVTLIVIDGTNVSISKTELYELQNNIRYIHYPRGIAERINKSLEFIKTKYVILAGDDEFYIPSALVKCMNFLDVNLDMVACCGTAVGFSSTSKNVNGYSVYPELNGYEIIDEIGEQRVLYHMSNYTVNQIYAVCRSDKWQLIFKAITEREFPVFAIGEYQFELYMSFAGKSKVLPELMWLRNLGETKPIRGTDPSLSSLTFIHWYKKNKYKQMVNEFNNISVDVIKKLSLGITNEEAKKIIRLGFDAFYFYERKNLTINQKIIIFLRFIIPLKLKNFIMFYTKKLFKIINNKSPVEKKEEVDLIEYAGKIEEKYKITINYSELIEIKEFILDWRKKRIFNE